MQSHARAELEQLYLAGVRAADPRDATARVVAELSPAAPPFIVAVGKAAANMAEGALQALHASGLGAAGGLVVSHDASGGPVGTLRHLQGSHPVPDESSERASEALAEVAARARSADDVIVLLSGGTTSLIAQAIPEIPPGDVPRTFDRLLRSGLAIGPMNAVRRRILRWGGGRLARALAPARVHCFIVSDVMGGELAAIGSGPCVPDPTRAAEVQRALEGAGVALPPTVHDYLRDVEHGTRPETPKAGDREFARVRTRIILDNSHAVAAIRAAADDAGLVVIDRPDVAIEGEAAELGRSLAHDLAHAAASLGSGVHALWVAGGEPTVTLPADATGAGGRCQELALACALEWDALGATSLSLLAAGTDGRDGPTDAAGAWVNASTVDRITRAGRDAFADLQAHDAYAALAAAGALIRTGPTGTNVNDVLIALLRGA